MRKTFVLLVSFLSLNLSAQKYTGLAETPVMGWNSWNTFATNIDENLVRGIADLFVEAGYKDAGYEYIVLDDGWMAKERDSEGRLVADPVKFPSGMKALADYVHSKGLKFGLYNCAGSKTCAGYPGSRGHEYMDALTYASWDVDYLKYDWCNTDKLSAEGAYITMRDALFAAKRPVVFSLCEWGQNKPWLWAKDVGQLWRTTGDISNCFDCEDTHGGTWTSYGVMQIAEMREGIRQYAGPGHWNDYDMLEVGNGMTVSEDRSHFALWCMLSSPLMMGNDIRKAGKETNATLTNEEVIAINQDKLGIEGFRFSSKDGLEIWAKPLDNNEWAICFLNRNTSPFKLDIDWNDIVIKDDLNSIEFNPVKKLYQIRDLEKHTDAGTTKSELKAEIPAHDVVMLRVKPKP